MFFFKKAQKQISEQPVEQPVEQARIPIEEARKQIKPSMLNVGEHGYACSCSIGFDENGYLWIEDGHRMNEKSNFYDIKITRLENGFEVDVSDSTSKWNDGLAPRYDRDFKVISLVGLEERDKKIAEKEEREEREKREQEREKREREAAIQQIISKHKLNEDEKKVLGIRHE